MNVDAPVGRYGRAVDAGARALALEGMTSAQLVKRAKLVEAVLDLVRESGANGFQMKEVVERSGVALGTVYRYFESKEHLLAAALAEWHARLARRVAGQRDHFEGSPAENVRAYAQFELRAMHRNPRLAELMTLLEASPDPNVRAAIHSMGERDATLFQMFLGDIPEERARLIEAGVGAMVMSATTMLVTGTRTYEEATALLDGVVGLLVNSS